MPREITTHKINGLNEAITVSAVDEPGSGGANHHYTISAQGAPQSTIVFQNGPIAEAGLNGVSNESLLAVLVDRLSGFQQAAFSCRENAIALTKLQEAMHWLHHRTGDRLRRGVEGTSTK